MRMKLELRQEELRVFRSFFTPFEKLLPKAATVSLLFTAGSGGRGASASASASAGADAGEEEPHLAGPTITIVQKDIMSGTASCATIMLDALIGEAGEGVPARYLCESRNGNRINVLCRMDSLCRAMAALSTEGHGTVISIKLTRRGPERQPCLSFDQQVRRVGEAPKTICGMDVPVETLQAAQYVEHEAPSTSGFMPVSLEVSAAQVVALVSVLERVRDEEKLARIEGDMNGSTSRFGQAGILVLKLAGAFRVKTYLRGLAATGIMAQTAEEGSNLRCSVAVQQGEFKGALRTLVALRENIGFTIVPSSHLLVLTIRVTQAVGGGVGRRAEEEGESYGMVAIYLSLRSGVEEEGIDEGEGEREGNFEDE